MAERVDARCSNNGFDRGDDQEGERVQSLPEASVARTLGFESLVPHFILS
jgi:hypothetical protein